MIITNLWGSRSQRSVDPFEEREMTEKLVHQTNNKINFDVVLQLLPCFQTFLSWKEDEVS